MSEWTENWKASNINFIRSNKEVEKVLERRRVDVKGRPGYIYAVKLNSGSFEVRTYVNGTLLKKAGFLSGVKAVKAYRELRDTLVINRAKVEKKKTEEIKAKEVKPKTSKKKTTTKKKTA